jgi:hypothetical protein
MKEDILFITEQIETSIEYLKSRGGSITILLCLKGFIRTSER